MKDTMSVSCDPSSDSVSEILERLQGMPNTPQTAIDLITVAAVVTLETGCDKGSLEAMVSTVKDSLSSGGFEV